MLDIKSEIIDINGPVIKGNNMSSCKARDMVLVGKNKLIGEIISIDNGIGTVQVFEETAGLSAGELIVSTGAPLSVTLGPGIIGNFFDGIERPLEAIYEKSGSSFIAEGIGLISLDKEKSWDLTITVKDGDYLSPGDSYAYTMESSIVKSFILVPPGISGRVISAKESGSYRLDDEVAVLENETGEKHSLTLCHTWPVRQPRPISERLVISRPLITGQRITDIFFPIAKGGSCAIPGGFGTGKTMMQHQLAKWSDADIIVYIGCGERGNEMTEVLEDFPKLIDPGTGKPLMERTVLIANTSNMPVAAREASIYTGVTIAEYYRDMGYHVAIMADSTSRWAEALREISGRLEEMPAEGGFPAYLPSRIASFYERAGDVKTLSGKEGSVTIIGAVSPPGGDFSEPVTENTKRFVSSLLVLDKNLAYIRHYPAVSYLASYSEYIPLIKDYYENNVSHDVFDLRAKAVDILSQDEKLSQIAQLVGEDVLPTDQRVVLEVAKLFKKAFLQQNATDETDTYVPLKKQYFMLKSLMNFYDKVIAAVKAKLTLTDIKNDGIFTSLLRMKYDIPNENYDSYFEDLDEKIDHYYSNLIEENSDTGNAVGEA